MLLVDDNAEMRRAIREQISKQEGMKVVGECANGLEALEFLGKTAVDAMVLDIIMPQMDGYDATRQIRLVEEASGRMHTPIVAMSANAFVEDIDKAYAAGMDSYVTKPIGIEEVRRTLYEYAHKRPLNHIKGSLKS